MKKILGLVLLAPLALGACSQTQMAANTGGESQAAMPEAERVAYSAIQDRDWTRAEAQLREARVGNPDDPYVMLNLAYVLQMTGRTEEAETIYRQVLDMKQNPYAAMPTGHSKRVKHVAADGLDMMARGE